MALTMTSSGNIFDDDCIMGLTTPEMTASDESSLEELLMFADEHPLTIPAQGDTSCSLTQISKADAFMSFDEKEKERKRKEKQRAAVKRHRKRKNEEVQRLKEVANQLTQEKAELEKKLKLSSYIAQRNNQKLGKVGSVNDQDEKTLMCEMDQSEKLLRQRKEILQRILEAWNLGGFDDMEDIAEEIYDPNATLLNPDYSEELRGIEPIMSHWQNLIDCFPDGIMEEYDIKADDLEGEKFRLNWVFTGTHVKTFNGIPPRNSVVKIKGHSYVTFKKLLISNIVITWNYREAMMKLLGLETPDPDSLKNGLANVNSSSGIVKKEVSSNSSFPVKVEKKRRL